MKEKSVIEKLIEQFDGKTVRDADKDIELKIQKICKKTPYSLVDLKEVVSCEDTKHYIICLGGGKNKNGEWIDYFDDLKETFECLKNEFGKVWLIQLENDCVDDVHYPYIGVA